MSKMNRKKPAPLGPNRSLRAWVISMAVGLGFIPPAMAGNLSYDLQSSLAGGSNSAWMGAENARVNAIKQAKTAAENEVARLLREAEAAAAATPEARFLSSLQSQIYFAVAQKVAQNINSLGAGQTSTFNAGTSVVSYTNNALGTELTVTITTPAGVSTMVLPTGVIP